jgi:hypothetical protein
MEAEPVVWKLMDGVEASPVVEQMMPVGKVVVVVGWL